MTDYHRNAYVLGRSKPSWGRPANISAQARADVDAPETGALRPGTRRWLSANLANLANSGKGTDVGVEPVWSGKILGVNTECFRG